MPCSKRTYPDQATADAALVRIHARSGVEPKPVASYQCRECKLWHLTSNRKRSERWPGKR